MKTFGLSEHRTYEILKSDKESNIEEMLDRIFSETTDSKIVLVGVLGESTGLRNILGSPNKMGISPRIIDSLGEDNYLREQVSSVFRKNSLETRVSVGYTYLDNKRFNKADSFFVNICASMNEGIGVFSRNKGEPYLAKYVISQNDVDEYNRIVSEMEDEKRIFGYNEIQNMRQNMKKIFFGVNTNYY